MRQFLFRIEMGKFLLLLAVGALLFPYQSCQRHDVIFDTSSTKDEIPEMGNGEPYEGLRPLLYTASDPYVRETDIGNRVDADDHYYRIRPAGMCTDSGGNTLASHLGHIFSDQGQVVLESNRCEMTKTNVSFVEIPAYNNNYLGYSDQIFEMRQPPVDYANEEWFNLAWCRTPGSLIEGTDVVIKKRLNSDVAISDESLLLDFTSGVLDSRVQFQRNDNGQSMASYYDASGVLQMAAPGAARFDHDPATGEPLGLLIEEQKTNLFRYSEEYLDLNNFQTTPWKSFSDVVPSTELAPDGKSFAWKFSDQDRFGSFSLEHTYPILQDDEFVFSWHVKAGTIKKVELLFTTNGSSAVFDLENGTVIREESARGGIIPMKNGWYRIYIYDKANLLIPDPGNRYVRLYLTPNGIHQENYQGKGDYVYIWGAQLEKGIGLTSYIPTQATPVTRAADQVSMNDMSWFNPTAGSMVAQIDLMDVANPWTGVFALRSPSPLTHMTMYFQAGEARAMFDNAEPFPSQSLTTSQPAWAPGESGIVGLAYESAKVTVMEKGQFESALPVAFPTGIDQLYLGSDGTSPDQLNGRLKRIVYWPRHLNDNELADVSTALNINNTASGLPTYTGEIVQGSIIQPNGYTRREVSSFSVRRIDQGDTVSFGSDVFRFVIDLNSTPDPVTGRYPANVLMDLDNQQTNLDLQCRFEQD